MESFKDELIKTAKAIVVAGKGILAADESTGTIGKRFDSIQVENNFENRRAYRELLFTSEGFENYISGVIMFEETLDQETKDGKNFVTLLQEKGVIPGIKVDKGVQKIPGADGETATMGLDTLAERCKAFYAKGCRFAKWRAVLNIGSGKPSLTAIHENAHGLARYAAICQDNGLVPIVEPEILVDGTHDINRCAEVSEMVFTACMKELMLNKVLLEGILLKPNMVTPGSDCEKKASAHDIAWMTVRTLSRTVLPAVPGIVFLSGGQSEDQASENLSEMNKLEELPKPWKLSFSYGRALQASCLKAWMGKEENVAAAKAAFLERAKANSEATLGKYEGGHGATESLHVKNYVY